MDSSHDFEEATFFLSVNDPRWYRAEIPESLTVSGIHRAVIEGDIDKAKRCIESGESVNKKENQCGYTPLHLAVMCVTAGVHDENSLLSNLPLIFPPGNVKMLEFLFAEKGIEVDSRCAEGRTPLYLATSLDDLKSVKKLIEAGSDVNASDDENDRPLHMSVYYPQICELLLRHGAVVSTDDKWRNTMHTAIQSECLEVMHMLLYYNVDANILNHVGCTPFMAALFWRNEEAQEILLEYVDDFNRISSSSIWFGSTLAFALQGCSPFTKDMIERGADVNYGYDPRIGEDDCIFYSCVHSAVNLATFKTVWERLRFNGAKNRIDLRRFLDYAEIVPAYLSVIIESDNFEVAVRFFSKDDNYYLFINKYAEKEFDLEQLTTLTCRLLQNGFCATSYDIGAVFFHYGYCELFRILLYMDNDLTRGWLPNMALPRFIFDTDFKLETVIVDIEDIPKNKLIQMLEYSICPRLVDALSLRYSEDESMKVILNSLPRVPSLIELARNAVRKQIWQSFKVANTCQFYTTIDHFEIPTLHKDILTFKRQMHIIEQ